jgi:hypothetical protein
LPQVGQTLSLILVINSLLHGFLRKPGNNTFRLMPFAS